MIRRAYIQCRSASTLATVFAFNSSDGNDAIILTSCCSSDNCHILQQETPVFIAPDGATENARPDIARPSKLWRLTSRDWTTRHHIARVDGHRETCFIVRVEAQYKLIFAARSII